MFCLSTHCLQAAKEHLWPVEKTKAVLLFFLLSGQRRRTSALTGQRGFPDQGAHRSQVSAQVLRVTVPRESPQGGEGSARWGRGVLLWSLRAVGPDLPDLVRDCCSMLQGMSLPGLPSFARPQVRQHGVRWPSIGEAGHRLSYCSSRLGLPSRLTFFLQPFRIFIWLSLVLFPGRGVVLVQRSSEKLDYTILYRSEIWNQVFLFNPVIFHIIQINKNSVACQALFCYLVSL